MDDLVVSRLSKELPDIVSLFTADSFDVVGAVVGQAAGNDPAAINTDRHDVAAAETPLDRDDSGRQKTSALLEQSARRSSVDHDGAGRTRTSDPAHAAGSLSADGR